MELRIKEDAEFEDETKGFVPKFKEVKTIANKNTYCAYFY